MCCARSLRAYAQRHQTALREGGVDLRAVRRARTLAQYDALVTCKACTAFGLVLRV